MSEAVDRPRESAPPPEDAGDQARADILAMPELRVLHHWSEKQLVSASLTTPDGELVATVDRVIPLKPAPRFLWILGDVRQSRHYLRAPDGSLLWEVLRKPNAGGTKADMYPVPGVEVVRAVRGMPWSRTDFRLVLKGGSRIGTVRWSGGLFGVARDLVDSSGTVFLETYDHGTGPWSDYSVRWTAEAAEPQRTAGWLAAVTLHTALTKTRN